jgi:hypothetical protein
MMSSVMDNDPPTQYLPTRKDYQPSWIHIFVEHVHHIAKEGMSLSSITSLTWRA